MFSFQKLAFAQRVLRARHRSLEKTAIFPQILAGAGRLAATAGKLGWKAVKNPIGAAGMALGGVGIYSEAKGAPGKVNAMRAGFDPKVQQYQSQQSGGTPPQA